MDYYEDLKQSAYEYHSVNTDDIQEFRRGYSKLEEDIIDNIMSFSSRMARNAHYTIGLVLSQFYIELCDSSVTTSILMESLSKGKQKFKLKVNFNYWLSFGKLKDQYAKKEAILSDKVTSFYLLHILSYKDKDPSIYALACDLETTQYLHSDFLNELDNWDLDQVNQMMSLNMPPDKTALEYYYMMVDEEQEDDKDKSGEGNSDNSDSGNPTLTDALKGTKYDSNHFSTDDESTIAQEDIKRNVSNLIEQAMSVSQSMGDISSDKMWGNLSHKFNSILQSLKPPKPQVNYRDMLKRLTGSAKGGRRRSYQRPSRKGGFGYKGYVTGSNKPHVLVAIDESGSMSNEEIRILLGDMAHIKSGLITVLQFDTELIDTNTYNKNSFNSMLKAGYKRKSKGGTNFKPVIQEFAKNHYSSKNPNGYSFLIIFTDGYAESVVPLAEDGSVMNSLKNKIRFIMTPTGSKQYLLKDYPDEHLWVLNETIK